MSDASGLRAALEGDGPESACALCGCRLAGDGADDGDRTRSDGGERPGAERELVVVEDGEDRAVCCGPCYRRAIEETGLRPRRVFKTGDRRRVRLSSR